MNFKKLFKYIILFFGYTILIFGFWSGYLVSTGGSTMIDGIINLFFPMLCCYSYLFFPIIMLVMIRLHKGKKKKLVPLLLGIIVISLNMLPLTGTPYSIGQTEAQFINVFGSDYMDKIPDQLKSKFKDAPFDLWEMYNYDTNFECNFTDNYASYLTVPVYNDDFYFDYFCPTTGGPFPTIINIHGGGYVMGGPGPGNMILVSRYLASQGYVVLDVEYGIGRFLNPNIDNMLGKLQSLLGREVLNKSYTILEATEQILGNLTSYIVNHKTELKINTSCVYIMGRSAGAGLGGMFFGHNSTKYPKYRNWFNNSLDIKGIVLFYPPTNYTRMQDSEMAADEMAEIMFGTTELNASFVNSLSPANLVDENAPPTLIIHGINDQMVPYSQSEHLKQVLDSYTNTSILISHPFYGHAFDLNFNTPAAQISLYYLERFLAITRYA